MLKIDVLSSMKDGEILRKVDSVPPGLRLEPIKQKLLLTSPEEERGFDLSALLDIFGAKERIFMWKVSRHYK